MRYTYPQNILLDVNVSTHYFAHDYWTISYANSFLKNQYFSKSLGLVTTFKLSKQFVSQLKADKTLQILTAPIFYSNSKSLKQTPSKRQVALRIKTVEFTNKPETKVHRAFLTTFRSGKGGSVSDSYLKQFSADRATLYNAYSTNNEESNKKIQTPVKILNPMFSLFDVNFIKKERFYTKLKYSRSPAYDIVSGGSAALLAGFIGFLISEKFGIELVDSGDFYIVFMYVVFFSFFCRPLLKILSEKNTVWDILSLNFLFEYLYFGFSSLLNLATTWGAALMTNVTLVKREYFFFYLILLLLGILL